MWKAEVLVHTKTFGLNYMDDRELQNITFSHMNSGWLQGDCERGNLGPIVTGKHEH